MQTVYCIKYRFQYCLVTSQYCSWRRNTAGDATILMDVDTMTMTMQDRQGHARKHFRKDNCYLQVYHPPPFIKSLCLSGSTLLSYYLLLNNKYCAVWDPCLGGKKFGMYTFWGWGEGGSLKKCTVCTLVNMLTFLDDFIGGYHFTIQGNRFNNKISITCGNYWCYLKITRSKLVE